MARNKIDTFGQFAPKQTGSDAATTEVQRQVQGVLADKFNTELKEKLARPTVEQTHTRTTFLLRNDLKARLDNLADQNKRGYKTDFINKSIEMLLDAIENQ